MDTGPEKIEDESLLTQIKKQATKVHLQSFGLAFVLTGLCFVIPVK